ncbi:Putative phosphoglycolate phosphatase-like, domain 2, HAD superfamily [Septoria linicola]|uniref:Phosphoglycolate phosphatase-like, domain 2, HAD superfamily n=1 Tax=Septoria linicola TaxID=215465 RepID=A0A9Q9EN19_9PEZI|nr:Putative phosphoglycolate phosphatase-like, domain 2, HAD superfamily [Septoria linicola]
MSFPDPQPKALFFDVFGTCVDWRTTVTDALESACSQALNRASSSIATRIRMKTDALSKQDWWNIAQEWRNSYLKFTRSIASDPSIPYKTVDQHHLDSLREILVQHELIFPRQGDVPADLVHDGSLFDEQDLVALSMIWHKLAPWPDTVQGLSMLNKKFSTVTLSNGNVSLLKDMVEHGGMPFTDIYSAEMFQSYKPSPEVYLGAAEKKGLQPAECMMVAAHLDDLKHAKQNGFLTLYVERLQEERHPELLDEGIPDVWVKLDEDGFVEAARKLGIRIS